MKFYTDTCSRIGTPENATSGEKMFERTGLIIAASTLIFSFILFFLQNGEFLGSLAAALLAAGLIWVSYVVLAWMLFAIRNSKE